MRQTRIQAAFFLVASLSAGDVLAAPELRIKSASGSEFASGAIDVPVPGGDNHVDLEIAVFESGFESAALEALAIWRVECDQPRACMPLELSPIEHGRGRTLTLPEAEFPPFRVIVSVPGSDATATFRVARAKASAEPPSAPAPAPEKKRRSRAVGPAPGEPDAPAASPASPSRAGSAPRTRGGGGARRGRGTPADTSSAAGASSGSPASFGGGSEEPPASPRDRKSTKGASQIDAGFETYYSADSSFGGGARRGPVTGQRGYNRDNVVPVIACSYAPDARGVVRLLCSDTTKKISKKPLPKKAALKTKKAPEKKAAPKKAVAKKSPARSPVIAANTRK